MLGACTTGCSTTTVTIPSFPIVGYASESTGKVDRSLGEVARGVPVRLGSCGELMVGMGITCIFGDYSVGRVELVVGITCCWCFKFPRCLYGFESCTGDSFSCYLGSCYTGVISSFNLKSWSAPNFSSSTFSNAFVAMAARCCSRPISSKSTSKFCEVRFSVRSSLESGSSLFLAFFFCNKTFVLGTI